MTVKDDRITDKRNVNMTV